MSNVSSPRLLFPNFDFEQRLADDSWNPPTHIARLSSELSCAMLPLAADGDLLWMPGRPDSGYVQRIQAAGLPAVTLIDKAADIPPGVDIVPWGWNDQVARLAGGAKANAASPPVSLIRRINARSYSAQQERERGVALPGTTVIRSQSELETTLGGFGDADVIAKAEFGASGREQLALHTGRIRAEQLGWLHQRLQRDGIVHLEPRVRIEREIGLQFELQDGTAAFLGATLLESDDQRQFAGSVRLDGVPPAFASTLAVAHAVAADIAGLGYFGPLGIDAACCLLADGTRFVRPLQDINARYTMGRLCLELQKLASAEETTALRIARNDEPARTMGRTVRLSPDTLDGHTVQHVISAVYYPSDGRP